MRSRPIAAIPTLGRPAWLATLAAFATLCSIIAYWGLQLAAPAAPVAPLAAAGEGAALPDLRAPSQLFGTQASAGPSAPAPSNIVVLGVLAAGARGSAVLAIDGKPGRAYGVGDRLSPSQSLAAVHPDRVTIDAGGLRSDLAAPRKPDLAVLTSGAGRERAAAAAAGANAGPGGATAGVPPPMPMPAQIPSAPIVAPASAEAAAAATQVLTAPVTAPSVPGAPVR